MLNLAYFPLNLAQFMLNLAQFMPNIAHLVPYLVWFSVKECTKKFAQKSAHRKTCYAGVHDAGDVSYGGQAWSAKQARGGDCSLQGPVGRNEKTLIGRINSWLSWDYKYLTNHDKLYFLTILLKTNLREKTIFACMIMFQ